MELKRIVDKVDGQVVFGDTFMKTEIDSACGADLMSDVLACNINPHTLLITSLINIQVMRTADIVDLAAILFVRGKSPGDDVIKLAKKSSIPLIVTDLDMFETCGRLFELGLKGS